MRLTTGSIAPRFSAETIGGRCVTPELFRGRPVLLKFYRFATCPLCNLHMRSFMAEHHLVVDTGLNTIVFYHSPAATLSITQRQVVPFDMVADPDKTIFAQFGVEQGLRGLVSPTVVREYMRALVSGFSPGILSSDGGITSNPADFIIDEFGRIAFARYGTHYADSLGASEIVNAWRSIQLQPQLLVSSTLIPS